MHLDGTPGGLRVKGEGESHAHPHKKETQQEKVELTSPDLLERAGFVKKTTAGIVSKCIEADEKASSMNGETFLAQNWAEQAEKLSEAVLRSIQHNIDTGKLAMSSSATLEESGVSRSGKGGH
jgi:hypothetical protein